MLVWVKNKRLLVFKHRICWLPIVHLEINFIRKSEKFHISVSHIIIYFLLTFTFFVFSMASLNFKGQCFLKIWRIDSSQDCCLFFIKTNRIILRKYLPMFLIQYIVFIYMKITSLAMSCIPYFLLKWFCCIVFCILNIIDTQIRSHLFNWRIRFGSILFIVIEYKEEVDIHIWIIDSLL